MVTEITNWQDVYEFGVDTGEEAEELFEKYAPGQEILGLPEGADTPPAVVGEAKTRGGYIRIYANDGDGAKIYNEMF